MKYLESTPQEQLAHAWAVAESVHMRMSAVHPRVLARCRSAAYHLSTPFALELLADVPHLKIT
jgi:hypothetical protein